MVLTRVGQTFPVGTTVGLYRVLVANSGVQQPGGEPVVTAVVAGNESLVFEDVPQDQPVFYAAAKIGSAWRSIQATTSVGEPVTDVAPVIESVEALESGKADLDPGTGKLVESQLPLPVVSASPEGNAGDILVYDGGEWVRLAKGNAGQQLIVRSDGTVKYTTGPMVLLSAWGAKGEGTDDTAAIKAATTAAAAIGGTVFGSQGSYGWKGEITFPEGTQLQGVGSGWENHKGTRFVGLSADAKLNFENSTSDNRAFMVDGAGVAKKPFRVGWSFGATFTAVSVVNALEDSIEIFDAQQATFYSCNSSGAGRDDLLLDGSTQSCLFSRFEANSPGRHSLRIGHEAGRLGTGTGFNRFDLLLCENQSASGSNYPILKIERCGAGGPTIFDTPQFVTNGGTGTAVAEIIETEPYGLVGKIEFRSPKFVNVSGTARVGLYVEMKNPQMPVHLSGMIVFEGALSAGVKAKYTETIRLDGYVQANITGGGGPVLHPETAPVRLMCEFEEPSFEHYHEGWGVKAALVAPRSRFIDHATEKLSWKDQAGEVHALY